MCIRDSAGPDHVRRLRAPDGLGPGPVSYTHLDVYKRQGILGACALLIGSVAVAQVQDMPGGPKVNQLNLHEGVTQITRDVMWLHWLLLTICIVIFVGVFGVMFYSIWACLLYTSRCV